MVGAESYSLEAMLAELIDEIIPGMASGSIMKTYLEEAVLQPGGHALLGTFRGPKTGRTVGTALVGRGHGLCPFFALGTLSDAEMSLVWWLFERGVRLDVPDAHDSSALVSGLAGPFGRSSTSWYRPNQMFNRSNLDDVFISGSARGPSLSVYSLLTLDPSGRGITSVEFSPEMLALIVPRLMDSLADPSRTPHENVQWIHAALRTSHASFTPLLQHAAAHWESLGLESSFPLPVPPIAARSPRL